MKILFGMSLALGTLLAACGVLYIKEKYEWFCTDPDFDDYDDFDNVDFEAKPKAAQDEKSE